MTWTHDGILVLHEWMPLAFAEGITWHQRSRRYPAIRDRNLYRLGQMPLCWGLWWAGWAVAHIYRPAWAQPERAEDYK